MTSYPAGAQTRSEWLVVAATTLLVVFHYVARADTIGVFSPARGWVPLTWGPLSSARHYVAAAVLLGVLPLLLARGLTRVSLRELGLGHGRWREGLVWLGVGVPLAILAGWIGSRSAGLRGVYPLDPATPAQLAGFAPYALAQLLYYGAWEVLFRGVLLFGLRPRIGAGPANGVQTALSVLAHFGRALDETAAALPAGLLFGRIALRTGSIWYIAVVHWLVGVSQDWFILTR
ncbi:MAG: lysostaphin resistance A-like protein [Gemmatimonadales bacterium]